MIRVAAILQLCIFFSILLWTAAEPFTLSYMEARQRDILFKEAASPTDAMQKRHVELIEQSFFKKTAEASYNLLIDLSPFLRGWMACSFIVMICILKEKANLLRAVLLLPLLSGLYWITLTPVQESGWRAQIPQEKELIAAYGKGPLHGTLSEQKTQLQDALRRHIVSVWGLETPSSNSSEFALQVERSKKNLAQAQLQELLDHPGRTSSSPVLAFVFFLWNCLFAVCVTNRTAKYRAS